MRGAILYNAGHGMHRMSSMRLTFHIDHLITITVVGRFSFSIISDRILELDLRQKIIIQ